MAFQTSLSGLNAAQANLSVTGNNIANASTAGFKKSRAEFADIYATSFSGTGVTTIGSGVRLSNVAQQFEQGNVEFTQNSLDLAINGEGFFMLQDTDGSRLYSRAGAFGVDRDGNVVNAHGQTLMSYGVNASGSVTNTTATPLRLDTSTSPAAQTGSMNLSLNLDAGESNIVPYGQQTAGSGADARVSVLEGDVFSNLDFTVSYDGAAYSALDSNGDAWSEQSVAGNLVTLEDGNGNTIEVAVDGTQTAGDSWAFTYADINPADAASYNYSTSTTIYDSLGGTHTATMYFRKISENTWEVMAGVNDVNGIQQTSGPRTLQFNPDGTLDTANSDLVTGNLEFFGGPAGTGFDADNGSNPMGFNVAVTDNDGDGLVTQQAGDSTVNSLTQDGHATGRLSGIDIDSRGVVFARYTNGQSDLLGAVAMVTFSNPQGLSQMGDTNWAETFESGQPQLGQAGSGTFGSIQSGALESSNVDLSKQLVNMIVAQRDFQANAKMISTEDQVTQSIINIR